MGRKRVIGKCWIWQGYKDKKGYGQVSIDGKKMWVHRVVFAIFNNGIRRGVHVHHNCFNPSCINPQHLETMSSRKNSGLHKQIEYRVVE